MTNGTINHMIKNCSYGNPNEKRKLFSKYLNRKEIKNHFNENLNTTKLIDFTEILDLISDKQ